MSENDPQKPSSSGTEKKSENKIEMSVQSEHKVGEDKKSKAVIKPRPAFDLTPADHDSLKFWDDADDNDLHEMKVMYKHRRKYHIFISGEVDLSPGGVQLKLRELEDKKIKYVEWTVEEDKELIRMYDANRITASRLFSEKHTHRTGMAFHRRRMFLFPLLDRLHDLYPEGLEEAEKFPKITKEVPGIVSADGHPGYGRRLSPDEENLAVEIVHIYGETGGRVSHALIEVLGRKSDYVSEALGNYGNRHVASFTQAEDKLLINGVHEFGDDWFAICETLPRRMPQTLEQRYKNLKRASKVIALSEDKS